MEFNIKRNDFVRPRDVRRDVVQNVCDHILTGINNKANIDPDCTLIIKGSHPHIHLVKGRDGKSMLLNRDYIDCEMGATQVRTCEMKMVFKLLQDAGYYIFKTTYEGYNAYVISKLPYYYTQKAERIDFDFFID